MPRKAETSAKAKRDQLRDRMRALGCTIPQIAAEMGRRLTLRPRVAWRHALGWPQWKVAQQYNTIHPGPACRTTASVTTRPGRTAVPHPFNSYPNRQSTAKQPKN